MSTAGIKIKCSRQQWSQRSTLYPRYWEVPKEGMLLSVIKIVVSVKDATRVSVKKEQFQKLLSSEPTKKSGERLVVTSVLTTMPLYCLTTQMSQAGTVSLVLLVN